MSYEFQLWLSVIAVTRFALTLALSQRERGGIATLTRLNSKRLTHGAKYAIFRLRLC